MYTHTHLYTRVHAHTHTPTHTYTHARMHARTHARARAYKHWDTNKNTEAPFTRLITLTRNVYLSIPGPFVRVAILSGGKKLKKKKTSTKRNNNNPVWNEALVFNVYKDAIKTLHTELAIYHENLLGNSELLGKVAIGPNSAEEELSHWNDVINSKSALARWHHLVAEDS